MANSIKSGQAAQAAWARLTEAAKQVTADSSEARVDLREFVSYLAALRDGIQLARSSSVVDSQQRTALLSAVVENLTRATELSRHFPQLKEGFEQAKNSCVAFLNNCEEPVAPPEAVLVYAEAEPHSATT